MTKSQSANPRRKKIEVANRELEATNQQLKEAIERANQMAVQAEVSYIEVNQIFNSSGDGMVVLDKDFNVLRVNRRYSAMSGVNNDKAVGK